MTPAVDPQALELARMKRLALALLVMAALLYALATVLEHRHPLWPWVAAFAEAAMVGAMADWFAVVALFRHPMGIPIPHTAIIPNNKSRIGSKLADFLCNHFLATPQVLQKLREMAPAERLAAWLSEPANGERLAGHAGAAAVHLLEAFDDERVRDFMRRTVVARLERVDFAPLAGELLGLLTAERRHQAVLDELLKEISQLLENENFQARLAERVAGEVDFLRYVKLDRIAGRVLSAKIVAGVGTLLGEMGDDPQHPLRLRFDTYMAEFIARLQHDDSMRLKGAQLRDAVLAHPALATYLHDLWSEFLDWLRLDLQREDSVLRARVARIVVQLGETLRDDSAMRQWMNDQLMAAAPALIERYREDIRRYVASRVDQWDTTELTRELERNIGRDLQFVRINGTLVGGLIGVIIHAVTLWARG
jgi:uncharacterized membrane-anchored protein YjiN (DUF445 family)